ncbi:MAG: hypothetical protein ACRD6X_14425 [Pyrinomonadaceae bacterium]
MFEQELYNEPAAIDAQEGDLFNNYEIKNWDLGPRIYKILAFSAVFNLVALLIFGQTDMLTRRGCESPWVGSVCQVLDMAYVGSMLFGTEREFVDAEYDQIDLGDSEITFIDVSGAEPRFRYPADYDKYANPEKFAADQAALNDPLAGSNSLPNPTTNSNDLLAQAQQLPTPNPNAVLGPIPDSPFSVSDTPNTPLSRIRNHRRPGRMKPPAANTTPKDQTVAQTDSNSNSNTNTNTSTPLNSDSVKAVEINHRPMVDLANGINSLREKAPLNLESEFMVTGKGKLDKLGKFDPKTFRYGPTTGKDEAVVEVVKDSFEALNEAGYLAYIKDIIGKDLSFVLQQDAENIAATFQTDFDNDSLAKQRQSSLDLLISIAKKGKQGENASQTDKDDLLLLEGVKTEVVGKTLKIMFVVPKGVAHPLIQRKLAEQAAENRKPSGMNVLKQNDNTALK